MNDIDTSELTWDDWDELQRPAPETTDFDTVVAAECLDVDFCVVWSQLGLVPLRWDCSPDHRPMRKTHRLLASARLQHKQMARYMCPKDTAGKS